MLFEFLLRAGALCMLFEFQAALDAENPYVI